MTSIKLTVTGAHAWASVTGPLTSGMVGIPVAIEYDEAWDGLTKNLMCRCSPWGSNNGENRAILNVGGNATVAHEVMQADMYLYLGVEGFSDDGKLVIPTTWARCGKIEYGANTCEDHSTNPELSVWNQLQTEMEQIKEYTLTQEQVAEVQTYAQEAARSALEARQSADEAQQAASIGWDILYYTPVVTQPTRDTLRFGFKPSITGAPIPNPVTVELPVCECSGETVVQDYYLLKSPSGTAYKVTVTDGGALQVVGVADSSPDDLIPGRLLVWCDDFDGDTIDPEKWMFRLDNEKYYGAEDVQVSDSVLTYPITYDAANDRWRNFYMMTSGLEDVKYGRVEARMKWDLGAFTAWWTVGQVQEKYKGSTRGIIWPRSGEIDIFEDEGDGKLDVGLHWGEIEDAGLNQSNDIRRVGEGIDVTQWHNYAMEWDESSVVIYVDNVEMTRYDISNIAYEDGTRPFNLPHYFILSAWCKNPESGKDYYCYVDWVRYYAPAGITAEIPIQSMSLEQTAVALNKNRVRELALTISPDYCTDYTMRWDSSDRSIATFDGGRVKALSNGVCELTVTAKNGVVARCDLTVSDSVLNNAADIVLEYGEKDTYYAGDTITITPVVTPKWATYLECNWTSSNESVATVANGVVTFVGGGEVTITATAKDNSGIARTAAFTSIAVIPDNIPTDGCVAKYTRKGWADGAWASDLEGGADLATDQYAQGEGYWFRSFLSSENSYVAANLDTSGAFTIAERVLTKAGMKLGGYIWQIAESQSDGKTSPVMHASLDYNGKYIVRYANTSGSIIVNNATVYQPLLNNISDELIVADMPLNLVFTHAADGQWATYANGALVANGTDGVAAETIPNAVLCLGAFPGVNRQKGEAFKFQAFLAYNKAMTAEEAAALNAALDEMYV